MARLKAALPAWIAVIGLFVVWEGAVRFFGIREFLLPAPSAIFTATIGRPGRTCCATPWRRWAR